MVLCATSGQPALHRTGMHPLSFRPCPLSSSRLDSTLPEASKKTSSTQETFFSGLSSSHWPDAEGPRAQHAWLQRSPQQGLASKAAVLAAHTPGQVKQQKQQKTTTTTRTIQKKTSWKEQDVSISLQAAIPSTKGWYINRLHWSVSQRRFPAFCHRRFPSSRVSSLFCFLSTRPICLIVQPESTSSMQSTA